MFDQERHDALMDQLFAVIEKVDPGEAIDAVFDLAEYLTLTNTCCKECAVKMAKRYAARLVENVKEAPEPEPVH